MVIFILEKKKLKLCVEFMRKSVCRLSTGFERVSANTRF